MATPLSNIVEVYCFPRWARGEDCEGPFKLDDFKPHRHTPREWERDPRYTMIVMDPDGWRSAVKMGEDRSKWLGPRDFEDAITRSEYELRCGPSTMMDKREWERMWEDRRREKSVAAESHRRASAAKLARTATPR